MDLADVARASAEVGATPSRTAKTARLAALLAEVGEPDELAVVVAWLTGEPPQRRTGIGWAALRDAAAPATTPSLTVLDVDRAFTEAAGLSGAGSTGRRRALVGDLMSRATAEEQRFLVGLLSGELRQGALEAQLVEATASVFAVPLPALRRAVMLSGGLPGVAAALLRDGPDALAGARLAVGTPVQPMLAASAGSVEEAVASMAGGAVVDAKLDGIRVQVHRRGDEVRVFTRSLDDITPRVPEIVAAARALPVTDAVLDGEAIAMRPDGRPVLFQETGARMATRAAAPETSSLRWFVFDVLHVDGRDVMDEPLAARLEVLEAVLDPSLSVSRLVVRDGDVAAAQRFFDDTVAAGHEGVVVKDLSSPWEAGRRGAAWRKVKPVHTLDLVVLAAEWGHGRRQGRLSNLHLGARDPQTGGLVMLGKTFKGLTDAMLEWQTQRFLELETHRSSYVVHVAPEQVVEVAFDGVQRSTRYPGGVALRFARVLRYRDDKRPDEADTIDTVRAFLSQS